MLVGLYVNWTPNSGNIISKDSLLQIWTLETFWAKDSPYGIAYEDGSSALPLYRKETCQLGVPLDYKINHSLTSYKHVYMHYDVAKRFGITAYKFPVYNLSSPIPNSCIAVLELLTTKKDPTFPAHEVLEIQRELQGIGWSLAAQDDLHEDQYLAERSRKKGKQVEVSGASSTKL
ncbi:uncharacterized protein LOC142176582 isoform X2 [Nicotiana tabacum]